MSFKINKLTEAFFLVIFCISFSLKSNAQETDYHGYKCLNFKFEGHDAKIVFPAKAEEQRHWIWRARFWGHEPQTEIALLEKGFHVVYVDGAEYCGNPDAVKLWNHFYDFLLKEYNLNPKAVLEGFSRGGLYVYNWGSENVEKVACIYADAPVCDLRSWPGGKGKGVGSPSDWKAHLAAYNQTEETINDFKGMPIYNCRKLAEAGVPVLHVCGAEDKTVPIDENTYVLEKNYKEAGGNIKVIVKEGIDHHPHSLKDPSPIVRFILSHTSPGLLDKPVPVESKMSVIFRGNIDNCRIKFEKEKKGRVAFLGGSITFNPGWRDSVCDYLKQRFPSTEFEFISAGIPSLGSTPGAMRFSRDVLSEGKVDLLFEEAAVNDATNGFNSHGSLRGMEGIIHQALASNPYMDIVIMHFADKDKMADYNNGKIPDVIAQHEKVAEYYNVSSINLAKEVNDRIIDGEFTWRDDFKDLHPSPFGQGIYFRTIKYFFDTSWKNQTADAPKPRILPEKILDQFSYINGHFGPVKNAKLVNGWKFVKNWNPGDNVSVRPGFVNDAILEASNPGDMLKLIFSGKAIGVFVTSGPDAGNIEYSIDGSDFKTVDQFTQWSKQLHLPWLIMLDDELRDGKHTLILKIGKDKNPESTGNVCRIHQFVLN
ncbi:MAG TPA: GDSL-type esterase/lipase family protein [Bacteroidales bacterium]|nr:GDSL-type esterase/lipase family protein [Bacteroidales bacterium]